MNRRPRLFNPRWNMAARRPVGPVPESLVDLLAALRAAYMVYRNAHWQSSGTGYYGNHLLLQRIYEDAAKHVDSVAERIVGYYGAGAVELGGRQVKKIQQTIEKAEAAGDDPLERSLSVAEDVRASLNSAYQDLKAQGALSMGWDDLLMSISSAKDEHLYLLQQALEGAEIKFVDRASNPATNRLKRSLTR